MNVVNECCIWKPQGSILLEMDLTVSPESYYYYYLSCVCDSPMQWMNNPTNPTLHLQFMHCPLEGDLMHLKHINLLSHLFTSTHTTVFEWTQSYFYTCIAIAIEISTACLIFLFFCSFFPILDINFRILFHRTLTNASMQSKNKCCVVSHRASEEEFKEENKWMREKKSNMSPKGINGREFYILEKLQNLELKHECYPEHLGRATARMKQGWEIKKTSRK